MVLPWQKARAIKAQNLLNAYRRLFSTDDGKAVLKDLMKSCHFHSTIIGKTPEETYHNEGMRSVVLRIITTSNLTEDEVTRFSNQLLEEDKDMFQ